MVYIKVVKRVGPKSSYHKKNIFFFIFLYCYEVMDDN